LSKQESVATRDQGSKHTMRMPYPAKKQGGKAAVASGQQVREKFQGPLVFRLPHTIVCLAGFFRNQ